MRCSAYITIVVNLKVCMVCGTVPGIAMNGNIQQTAMKRETMNCEICPSFCNYTLPAKYHIIYL